MNNLVDKILEGADVKSVLETSSDEIKDIENYIIDRTTVLCKALADSLFNVGVSKKEGKTALSVELNKKTYAMLLDELKISMKNNFGLEYEYSSSSNNGSVILFFDKKEEN